MLRDLSKTASRPNSGSRTTEWETLPYSNELRNYKYAVWKLIVTSTLPQMDLEHYKVFTVKPLNRTTLARSRIETHFNT